MWLDDGELEALPAELSDHELALEAARALSDLRGPRPPRERTALYLPCPVCGASMNRHNYHDVSGVILNQCAGHGTWLDFANAEALLRLLADGRLLEIEKRAAAAAEARILRATNDLEATRMAMAAERQSAAVAFGQGHTPHRAHRIYRAIVNLLDLFT
jgi:Zn-finger nucleic acid-binding protein